MALILFKSPLGDLGAEGLSFSTKSPLLRLGLNKKYTFAAMKIRLVTVALLLLLWPLSGSLFAQATDTSYAHSLLHQLEKLELEGYGAFNYYHFDWQTDSSKRDAIDNER